MPDYNSPHDNDIDNIYEFSITAETNNDLEENLSKTINLRVQIAEDPDSGGPGKIGLNKMIPIFLLSPMTLSLDKSKQALS